jgi:hypothetical protein
MLEAEDKSKVVEGQCVTYGQDQRISILTEIQCLANRRIPNGTYGGVRGRSMK